MNKFDEAFNTIMEEIQPNKKNTYVIIWYINGTSKKGLYTVQAKSKGFAERRFKNSLPKRKKYDDPKYGIQETLVYNEGEEIPDTVEKAMKDIDTHNTWGPKQIDADGDPRTGGYGKKEEQPKLGSLYL